ncbi:unnamed protein product [Cuscuta epithymum]|uniref:RNase H type-1 domain-containing protein n=2 Tax=Cuscuta epithymum TaxID=186058 RepID=A0AAV0E421_9ASTE|nr:unnamed protein product [Cuscuta epithymum]
MRKVAAPSLKSQLSVAAPRVEQWTAPPPGYIKCNVDAALFDNGRRSGCGVCARDCRGRYIMARTEWWNTTFSPEEAEAWALRQAMTWMITKRYIRVIFESDCKRLVDDIRADRDIHLEYGSLVDDCRLLLKSNNEFQVVFTRRQANNSAHALARVSINHASPKEFFFIPLYSSHYQ